MRVSIAQERPNKDIYLEIGISLFGQSFYCTESGCGVFTPTDYNLLEINIPTHFRNARKRYKGKVDGSVR